MSLLNRMRDVVGPHAGDVEAVRTALQRLSPEELQRLQEELNAEDDRVEQSYAHCTVLYHGAPARTAARIRHEGFRLTTGRRSGFLGAERVVENQAIFLAEERKVAAAFGGNRADFDGAEVLEVRADIRQMLDMTSWARVPRALRELGERLVQEYDGTKAPKAPTQADMFWLLDQPAFVGAIRAHGYDAARFMEAAGTMRAFGFDRKGRVAVAVFDPLRLHLAPPPRGSLKSLMWHLQQRAVRSNTSRAVRRTLSSLGLPTTWYHGTHHDFERLKPRNDYLKAIWLGDLETATVYAEGYLRQGVIQVELDPNARVVDMRDVTGPIMVEYLALINEQAKYGAFGSGPSAEEWANKWYDYGELEHYRFSGPFFRSKKVDALLVRDVQGWSGGKKTVSLAVLNKNRILAQKRVSI